MSLDIQDLVDAAKSDLKKLGREALLTNIVAANPGLAASPIALGLLEYAVDYAISKLVDSFEFGAFLLNSGFLTSAQAADYREKVAARLNMHPETPDDEWERIEREANAAFRDAWNWTR